MNVYMKDYHREADSFRIKNVEALINFSFITLHI